MPLLDEAHDLFGSYDLSSGYISIPDSSDLVGELAQAGVKSASAAFALQNFRSFASVAQIATSRQAAAVGIPAWIVEPIKTLFTKIPLVSDGRSLADGVVDGVVGSVDRALEGAATAVPIVGAVLRMGVSIFQLIRDSIEAEKQAGPRPPPIGDAMIYDMGADTLEGNLIANVVGTDDWTELFLPPSNDPIFSLEGVARVPGGAASGVQWASHRDLGWGLFPGIGDQLGVYQVPGYPGPNAFGPIFTRGTFRPSGPKFATMLWQSVMKPSMQMFLVDSHAVEDAWAGYFQGLWAFSNAEGYGSQFGESATESLRWAIRRTASYAKLYGCKAQIAASKKGKIADCRGESPAFALESALPAGTFSAAKLESRLGALTWRYTDIVRYVCGIHRERAAAALGTLVVAYVPSNAPLLLADEALAELHRSMRAALLEHEARYQVEIDLVPETTDEDRGWRSDLHRSRMQANVGFKAGSGRMPQSGKPPKIPTGDRWPTPPEPPPPGLPADSAPAPSGGVGTGLALAAAGILAVGLGVAVARR